MLVLYCLDPLDRRRPDAAYAAEADVAERLGIPLGLTDHDALVQGDFDRAVRRIPIQPQPVVGGLPGLDDDCPAVLPVRPRPAGTRCPTDQRCGGLSEMLN